MSRKEAIIDALFDTGMLAVTLLCMGILVTLFLIIPSILFGVPGLCVGAIVLVFVAFGVDRYIDYRDETNPR